MKIIRASLFALTTLTAGAFAGPPASSTAETRQTSVEQSEHWYRDHEWNIDLFGSYAFGANSADRYLNSDHAWGGGFDASYFLFPYLGLGLEGYALDADDLLGEASGNLIFRYPIPGSRFAPYGYAGGGVIFNGSRVDDLVARGRGVGNATRSDEALGLGQFGTGIELRVTPQIGIIHDFSWNVIDGPRNNFGMVRAGVRFAF